MVVETGFDGLHFFEQAGGDGLAVFVHFDAMLQFAILDGFNLGRRLTDELALVEVEAILPLVGELGGDKHEHRLTRLGIKQILVIELIDARVHSVLSRHEVERGLEHIFLVLVIDPVVGVLEPCHSRTGIHAAVGDGEAVDLVGVIIVWLILHQIHSVGVGLADDIDALFDAVLRRHAQCHGSEAQHQDKFSCHSGVSVS